MPPTHLNTFDDDGMRDIASAVRRLQAQVQNIEALADRVQRDSPQHVIRTGVTTTNKEFPEYPDCGCVFVVKFCDAQFEEQPGGCDDAELQPEEWPAKTVVAGVYGGHYITEGCKVLLVKVPAIKGSQWYIIPRDQTIIRFQLISNLCPGSFALARMIRCDGAFCGDPFFIFDMVGTWHGYGNTNIGVGYQGWAVRMYDKEPCYCPGRWEVLFLEAPCRWLQFQLAEDNPQKCADYPNPYGIKAVGLRCWGSAPNGRDPTLPMADSQGLFRVYDRCGLFPHAKKDACGYAVYDETDRDQGSCFGKYIIQNVDQMSPIGTAQLLKDMCKKGPVSISQFEPCMFAPFSQKCDDVEAAQNPYSLCGQEADQVHLTWCEMLCDYVVTQVTHKQETLPVRIELKQEDCEYGLTVYKRQFCVQYCNSDEEDEDLIFDTVKCEVVGSISFAGGGVTSTDEDTSPDCELQQSKMRLCVWGSSCEDAGTSTVLEFKAIDPLVDVSIGLFINDSDSDDTECLLQTSQMIFVPCVSEETVTECITELTDCESEGSSS